MERNQNASTVDHQILLDLVKERMPFGKYKDWLLCDLPEAYLVWFHRKGFPPGSLGTLLSALYEIRLNGLQYLLEPLKEGKTRQRTTNSLFLRSLGRVFSPCYCRSIRDDDLPGSNRLMMKRAGPLCCTRTTGSHCCASHTSPSGNHNLPLHMYCKSHPPAAFHQRCTRLQQWRSPAPA